MDTHAMPTIEPIEMTLDRMRVTTVFGEPIREGNTTVIPVAEVRVNFGYGFGSGEGANADGATPVTGGGGGLGARAVAQPRGYLRINADGVRYEPIMNQGPVALAAFFLAGWIVFWVSKTIREASHAPAPASPPASLRRWLPFGWMR